MLLFNISISNHGIKVRKYAKPLVETSAFHNGDEHQHCRIHRCSRAETFSVKIDTPIRFFLWQTRTPKNKPKPLPLSTRKYGEVKMTFCYILFKEFRETPCLSQSKSSSLMQSSFSRITRPTNRPRRLNHRASSPTASDPSLALSPSPPLQHIP